jgi:heme-degrading monooxygenase HmoA
MHCVTWTYVVPPELDEATIRAQFAQVAGNYLGVPGLIRKYFGFSEDGQSVVGIYLWDSEDEANAFYTDEWMAGVTERWGAAPLKQEWVVPVVAESATGQLFS